MEGELRISTISTIELEIENELETDLEGKYKRIGRTDKEIRQAYASY